ncbi:hypothetical protein SKAU_G00016280 [Synaphobranchus kaupii]|uniref:Uncharacterized protein n=1 Tax=Synaphobranchus kaupii TaxID=118154 RepID=A0A9Q1JDF5_SYNKA|nr:hypothetical protein SKAU_G00016280 [Synaphobranchus kaupii]
MQPPLTRASPVSLIKHIPLHRPLRPMNGLSTIIHQDGATTHLSVIRQQMSHTITCPHPDESTYKSPRPTIPDLVHPDARKFSHLRIALENILPDHPTEQSSERLWKMHVLPYRSERAITRSKQDQEAAILLEQRTVRIEVDKVHWYATPLLHIKNMPHLLAPKEAVLPHLHGIEKRLAKTLLKQQHTRQKSSS